MCYSNLESGLYGTTVYESGLIDEVIERHLFAHNQTIFKIVPSVLGFGPISKKAHDEYSKKMHDYFALLDSLLSGKTNFVADRLTLADVYVVVTMNLLMATLIDEERRKQLPNLTSW